MSGNVADIIRGVETFAVCEVEGDRPGEVWRYSDADVEAIARNFGVLSAGPNPVHRVPVVESHNGVEAAGWVAGAAKLGELMLTDWQAVSPELRKKIAEKRLAKVSPEIKRDFRDRNGNLIAPGPYLYRVAVLGADAPRVKGLKDVEAFADRVFKFADNPGVKMDKAQATEVLTKAGVDPAVIATMAEGAIIAVASKWTPPATATATVQPTTVVPIAQPVAQTFADPAAIRDLVQKTVTEIMAPATKQLTDSIAAENAARERRAAEERQAEVRLFCDRMATANKLSPAENDEGAPASRRSALLRIAAQPPVTHKFADPADKTKTVEKTELRLQMEEIESRQARKFSEKAKAPQDGQNADPFAKKVQERYKAAIERHDALAAASKN